MSITPLLEIASSYCLIRGLGLRRPLLTKNMITAWICALRNGADAMVHGSISELSTMPAMGHSRQFGDIRSTSAFALEADTHTKPRDVSKVPTAEIPPRVTRTLSAH